MKKIRLFLMFGLFIGGLVLTSCTKEGEVGPEGPAGKDGNANVNSKEFTITNWVKDGDEYKGTISYSAITADIIDKGAVLVYLANGNGGYMSMPISFVVNGNLYTFTPVFYEGGVTVWASSTSTSYTGPTTGTFKVVVIDGNSARKAKTTIDFSNYKEVKDYFNL